MLFVEKKDSSLHLCVDFQELNHIIQKNKYLLPLISDLLDSSKKAYIYTKINLYYTYHLEQITEENEWKTAFYTCYEYFKWVIMPFSLTNAPAAFQFWIICPSIKTTSRLIIDSFTTTQI